MKVLLTGVAGFIGMLLDRLGQVLAHGGDKGAAKIQRF